MKQILTFGGCTVLGAVAAVALMKAIPDESSESSLGGPAAAPAQAAGEEPAVPAPKAAESAERSAVVRPLIDDLAESAAELDMEELEGRREEFRDAMRERQLERMTNKMAKWSAALGLDEAQQEKLLDLANAQFDELEGLAVAAESGDPAAISNSAKRAMAIMSGRALEESLAEVLTPDQRERYEQFGNRQNESRAEARTLRQLATLQEDLMLTPQQRNDVYGILYEESIADVEGDSDVGSMIEQFASQAGVTLDPSLQGMIASLANRGLEEMASGRELDGESVKEMAEDALNDSINGQVDRLAPVLSEAQLELYRNQLEERLGNLGNMIPRGEAP